MSIDDTEQERRTEYDVTNTVRVSSVPEVRREVTRLLAATYPGVSPDPVWLAFHDFERLFYGEEPGFLGCDTSYHDVQHTLDMTLAMARLVAGYEQASEPQDRLGPERAIMGIVTSLFHDAGYIRHEEDTAAASGAEFTLYHVSRSARYLESYLPKIGLARLAPIAKQIVHYTGYEMNLDHIELDDPRDCIVGHLLGTADLLAQMADRCYLEKCRDRLFPEFVLGGAAIVETDDGLKVNYRSGVDVLNQTLDWYEQSAKMRLIGNFNRAYRYLEVLYEGRNPYLAFINKNLRYLAKLRTSGEWWRLRRRPPCFTAVSEAESRLQRLAALHVHKLAKRRGVELTNRRGPQWSPAPDVPGGGAEPAAEGARH
jgi:hypothetical protein